MDKANLTNRSHLVPPIPAAPEQGLSLPAFLRAIRTNTLTMWTTAAYEQDVVIRRFFGRSSVLVNAPEAIRRVLVDNPGNYRRSPASIRILRPITGNGLLLSEGEAWRHQRRIIAPALAPRVMPMLARHIVETAQLQIASIEERVARGPVDLLALMQGLTLEIAGRSMFSLEMRAFGPQLRQGLTEFAQRFGRPFLFDMLLPPSVPTLRDLRRRRFQARWMRLIETIMHDRMREAQPETPRDLFDLLRAARDPETGEAFSASQLRDQLATLLLAGHETTAVTLVLVADIAGAGSAGANPTGGGSARPGDRAGCCDGDPAAVGAHPRRGQRGAEAVSAGSHYRA